MKIKKLLLLPIISLFAVSTSFAETRITYKSANQPHHITKWLFK